MTGVGREFDLQLHLLDRQVTDSDGRLVCKIDDLDLETDEVGQLYVTRIVVGPRALAGRLGGRLGRWMAAISARLSDAESPPTIEFSYVADIGDDIKLGTTREQLDVEPLERWVHDHVISRIPGSGHASS
jgi:sporulation protein YlmC with PRC-barrel domain